MTLRTGFQCFDLFKVQLFSRTPGFCRGEKRLFLLNGRVHPPPPSPTDPDPPALFRSPHSGGPDHCMNQEFIRTVHTGRVTEVKRIYPLVQVVVTVPYVRTGRLNPG